MPGALTDSPVSESAAATSASGVAATTPSIDEIIAIDDPGLRALWITQTYAELRERLIPAFGPDHTWCSFATWTATTAGAVIRCPDLPRMVDQLLVGSEDVVDMIVGRVDARTRFRRRAGLMSPIDRSTIEDLVDAGLRNVSERTDRSLTATFARVAPLFVALADLIEDHPDIDAEIGDPHAVLDEIDIPDGEAEPLLRLAFEHYVRAMGGAVGAHARAQFVLTANVAIVVDEQRTAHDDLVASLCPTNLDLHTELRRSMSSRVGPLRTPTARWVHDDVEEDVADLWHHVATRLLMAIVTPREVFHVGRDVPLLDNGDRFPVMLDEIDHPALERLIREWDPTDGTGEGARAHDWADLDARVGYLFNLFRSRQRDRSLGNPPFTPGDLAAMHRGEVPPLS